MSHFETLWAGGGAFRASGPILTCLGTATSLEIASSFIYRPSASQSKVYAPLEEIRIAPGGEPKSVAPKAKKKFNFFSAEGVFFFGAFLEGNGLFWEVVGKIDFCYKFYRFLPILSHF